MKKGAIIYISSNREEPEFEQKIFEDMLSKKGNLPVYVVAQKERDFYFADDDCNVCYVGDVGASGFNFCRQLQLVIKFLKHEYPPEMPLSPYDIVHYVISCEADCLYSPDYFKFIPPKLDAVYRNTNNYVIPYKQDVFYTKDSQTAFQVAGRDFLLERLNHLLKGQPQWSTKLKNFPKEIGKPFLEGWETFKTKYGCFQIKTGKGMRRQTRHGKEPILSLPYWGTAKEVREKYL